MKAVITISINDGNFEIQHSGDIIVRAMMTTIKRALRQWHFMHLKKAKKDFNQSLKEKEKTNGKGTGTEDRVDNGRTSNSVEGNTNNTSAEGSVDNKSIEQSTGDGSSSSSERGPGSDDIREDGKERDKASFNEGPVKKLLASRGH